MGLFSKIFGTKNDREVRALDPIVQAINSLENETRQKSDHELLSSIQTLKENISKDILAMESHNKNPKKTITI